MKTKLLGALMFSAMLASGTASAAAFTFGTTGPATGGAGSGSWEEAMTVSDLDVPSSDSDWTFINSNLPGTVLVTLDENTIGAVDFYTATFNFTGLPTGFLNNQDYFIDYEIQIYGADEYFTHVALDSTDPAQNQTSVTKDFFDSNNDPIPAIALGSINGVPDSTSVPGQPQYLKVHEVFHAGPDGVLSGSTNTFQVGEIHPAPEPLTMSLLGIGLAAFGARRRFA